MVKICSYWANLGEYLEFVQLSQLQEEKIDDYYNTKHPIQRKNILLSGVILQMSEQVFMIQINSSY